MTRCYTPFTNNKREKESKLDDFRLAKGLTIKETCEGIGLVPWIYTSLNSGSESPVLKDGKIKTKILRLCERLECSPEDAFPRYFCSMERFKNLLPSQVHDISMGNYINNPISMDEIYDRKKDISEILWIVENKLDNKKREIWMRVIVNEETYEEISKSLGVSEQAIYRMYKKSNNIICHWARINLSD